MTSQNSSRREGAALFAADEDEPDHQLGESQADAATQPCACPVVLQIVEVGFTDQPDAPAMFGGMRTQYVNLTQKKVRRGDTDITSDNQLGNTPPIMVRVTPPQATTVRVRLRRTLHRNGFPSGSSTLSSREQGLAHLSYSRSVSTHTTDANGVLILNPGKRIAALGGGEYKVEASLPGKAWVPGSNSVRIKRRVYIRPVVRYAAGAAAAMTAINAIRSDLRPLDIEVKVLPRRTGGELGVLATDELSPSLIDIGKSALNSSTQHIKDLKPHSVAVIVGQFGGNRPRLTLQTFSADIRRRSDGTFPASFTLNLSDSTSSYVVVPMTDGTHFSTGFARVRAGSINHDLSRADLGGLNSFSSSIPVNLSGIGAVFPRSVSVVRLTVRVIAINSWAVGWAYTDHPVIYLNMRDPNTDATLAANEVRALVVHELGHKLHLAAPGDAGQPDKQPHHYPSFNQNGVRHQGPHCSDGVPTGTDPWDPSAEAAATCTMWGALKGVLTFCDECKTSLRKIDIAGGF